MKTIDDLDARLRTKMEADKDMQRYLYIGLFVAAVVLLFFGWARPRFWLDMIPNMFSLLTGFFEDLIDYGFSDGLRDYCYYLSLLSMYLCVVAILASFVLQFVSGLKYKEGHKKTGDSLVSAAFIAIVAATFFYLAEFFWYFLDCYRYISIGTVIINILSTLPIAFLAIVSYLHMQNRKKENNVEEAGNRLLLLLCFGFVLMSLLLPLCEIKYGFMSYLYELLFSLSLTALSVMMYIGTLASREEEAVVSGEPSEEGSADAAGYAVAGAFTPPEGNRVSLRNSVGLTKEVKIGFSWTGLFFGIFVPMVRGDWAGFFIWLLVDLLTCGLGWLVFPFVYNKTYTQRLIEKRGYLPTTENDMRFLNSKGITVAKIYQP